MVNKANLQPKATFNSSTSVSPASSTGAMYEVSSQQAPEEPRRASQALEGQQTRREAWAGRRHELSWWRLQAPEVQEQQAVSWNGGGGEQGHSDGAGGHLLTARPAGEPCSQSFSLVCAERPWARESASGSEGVKARRARYLQRSAQRTPRTNPGGTEIRE